MELSCSKSEVISCCTSTLTLILLFTQGTFLVGQPAQGSGKQGGSSSAGHAASSPATVTQQAIRVTAGQKAAILAQVSSGNKIDTKGAVVMTVMYVFLNSFTTANKVLILSGINWLD